MMIDEKVLLNRIIEIVDYDRQRVINKAHNDLIATGHYSDFGEHVPDELAVTWLLKETLRKLLNQGTMTPRAFTVGAPHLRGCAFVAVVSDDEQYARLQAMLDEIKSWQENAKGFV